MKRIESFLSDYGYVIRFGLAVFWLLWAAQLFCPLRDRIEQEINYQRSRSAEQDAANQRQLYEFVWKKIAEAEKMEAKYGPFEFFSDLKEVRTQEQILRQRSATGINQLFILCSENVKKGYFTNKDVDNARLEFTTWVEGGGYPVEQSREELRQLGLKKISQNVFWWLLIMYLRTIFLVIPFYLVRMSDRKGILETILADKKKFVLAAVGWVFYFFRYPFNVIKEICIEAELRRIGDFFRVLSEEEKELIKKVDWSWITGFRKEYGFLFRRGILLALVATMLCYFLPVLTFGAEAANREMQYIAVKTDLPAMKVSKNVEKPGLVFQRFVLIPNFLNEFFIPTWLYERILVWEIDHVPIFSFTFCSVNNLSKGERNEKSCYSSYSFFG